MATVNDFFSPGGAAGEMMLLLVVLSCLRLDEFVLVTFSSFYLSSGVLDVKILTPQTCCI